MPLELEPCDPAEVGMSPEKLSRAVAVMQRQFDEGRSPMLVAMVARHGKVVFAHAIGDHRPGGPPLTFDSVLPVSSGGKPITAATVLALVERGLIGMNEPVQLHLPELRAGDNGEVMVHHLLTHTSGFDHEVQLARIEARVAAGLDDLPPGTDVLEHLLLETGWDMPRTRAVDELMQYANYNYALLGEIVRRVTGLTLDAAARELILDPAGMTSAAYIVPEDMAEKVIKRPHGIPFAPGHPGTVLIHDSEMFRSCDDGGLGLHTTAPDLLRFQQMILDGGQVGDRRVLSRASVRAMCSNQIPGIPGTLGTRTFSEGSWSFGYAVSSHTPFERYKGGTSALGLLSHAGAGGCMTYIDPHLGINAVYFEILTEMEQDLPESWVAHRFQDVVTASVVD